MQWIAMMVDVVMVISILKIVMVKVITCDPDIGSINDSGVVKS